MVFEVMGPPEGKRRHRSMMIGGKVHTYNPEENRLYEEKVRQAFVEKAGQLQSDSKNPLRLYLLIGFEPPKSTSKRKRQKMLSGEIFPCVKPDFDNVSKIICDALNKVAFDDDRQIVEAHIYKRYTERPFVRVQLEEVDGNE